MQNKRGQGLSTSAIVLIILGVAILVFLILGFTMGWSRILPWIGGNNVDSIVQQCSTACMAGNEYNFCSEPRELKAENRKITTSCATFSVIGVYAQYGIEECDTISCDFTCAGEDGIKIGDKLAVEREGNCEDTEEDITSIAKVTGTNKCCITKITLD